MAATFPAQGEHELPGVKRLPPPGAIDVDFRREADRRFFFGHRAGHLSTLNTIAEPSINAPEVTTQLSWRASCLSPARPWTCITASATVFIPCTYPSQRRPP